jgi:tripartite-type tricarboxylate transporter receptor subunit TctC
MTLDRQCACGQKKPEVSMQPQMSRRRLLSGIGGAALAAALAGGGVAPARAVDFYQGKTLTVIVGYAPGGGVDATARAVTRHLSRFIPGQPNIVEQNMEGAAGIVATNYLSQRVAPDGLTVAIPGRSWYIESIVRRAGLAFDAVKMTYIGSPGAVTSAAFVRASLGIKTFDELKSSRKTVTFGALGAGTPTAMVPALLAANGAPVKVILGYVSTARVLFALEQGEIDGSFTVGNALASRADLYAKVVPVVQTGSERAGVAQLRDVIRERERPVHDLIIAPDSVGVPLIGPAGMPAEATDILRKAFLAMARDPDYQADARKVELPVGNPIGGAQLAAMIRDLAAATTPAVITEFTRLAGSK